MQNIIFSVFLFMGFFSYGNAIEAAHILRDSDPLPYSFERKVSTLKRIGIEYCMEQDNFKEQSFWLWHFKRKLELYKNIDKKIVNFFSDEGEFARFKSFIDNKAKAKTILLPRLYGCLKLYDSKEYQDEVERIVKKYCKDCE